MSLGRTRLLALGGIGIGLVFALMFGVGTIMSPNYAPLYNSLSASAASQVVTTLEQAGFKVMLSDGGSTVSVPQDQVPRARMALADGGLPNEGVPGWELFDQSSGLGMNSFMQKVNRLRALEGELARSIQSLSTVEAARVHLVLPEREAFSRSRPVPSASVIVRSRSNSRVTNRQALSIRALIAAAVPEMSPSQVTVISSNGETILADGTSGSAETTLETSKVAIEDRLANNISNILTARVGAGNARVQVAVNLNHERQVITAQNYDPDQRVVRSTESSEETSNDGQSNNGDVDIGNNLPDALGGGNGGSSTSERATTREIVNYEIGSSNTETIREAGEVERISIAVLVNGVTSVDENGVTIYEERPKEELDRLRELIVSASGINLGRGDSISVDSLQFMDYNNDLSEPISASLGQIISESLGSILRGIFALAVVAAVLILGVRPSLKLMLEAPRNVDEPEVLAASDGATGLPPNAKAQQLSDGRSSQPTALLGSVDGTGIIDELPPFISGEGSLERQRINAFTNIVDQKPEESMKVINHWLAESA